MHAEDLISDFWKGPLNSYCIKAAIACQEVTMPFVSYFPPFLSIYTAEPHIPSSFNDEDNKSDQGYSDEDQPMSPEPYNSDKLSTPITEHQPTWLTTYNNDPFCHCQLQVAVGRTGLTCGEERCALGGHWRSWILSILVTLMTDTSTYWVPRTYGCDS